MRESCDLGEGRPPASGGVSIKGPLNLVWEDLRTALCGLLWNDTWQSIASRLGAFVVTTLVSAVLVAHVRRWADRRRVVATPNERSLHNRPVPNGGGLVIVGLTLPAIVVVWGLCLESVASTWLPFVGGAGLIAAVSWLDDLRSVPAAIRLAVHLTAAALAVASFGPLVGLGLPGWGAVAFGSLGLPLSLLWIAGLTSAYNFMDGIDGIAAGQAITAGLGWAIVGWLADDLRPMLLGGLLTATSAGFLVHNWSPASIFMGDIGSAFLGYCFATLGLLGGGGGSGALIGILLVWPFVFDTAFTFCVRLRRRENIFKAHRSHLYQRLVLTGLSHRAVTLLYVALAVLGAAAGVSVEAGWPAATGLVLAATVLAPSALWAFVRHRERRSVPIQGPGSGAEQVI